MHAYNGRLLSEMSDSLVPALPTKPELAQAALETLQALRTHFAGCRQCHLSPEFCEAYKRYTADFEREYEEWATYRPLKFFGA